MSSSDLKFFGSPHQTNIDKMLDKLKSYGEHDLRYGKTLVSWGKMLQNYDGKKLTKRCEKWFLESLAIEFPHFREDVRLVSFSTRTTMQHFSYQLSVYLVRDRGFVYDDDFTMFDEYKDGTNTDPLVYIEKGLELIALGNKRLKDSQEGALRSALVSANQEARALSLTVKSIYETYGLSVDWE